MSKKDALRIPDYLDHILEAIDRIHRYNILALGLQSPAEMSGLFF